MIYKDISITVNSVDLSSSLRALTMSEGVEQQASEGHGDDWRTFEAGMRTVTITADFWQDYSSGGVDDTISGLLSDTDGFTVAVLPTSAAVGASNPSFTATMNIANYDRFTGTVGDRAICTVEFALATDSTNARATA